MSIVSTWLPPEFGVVQPYSMGPLTRWDPTAMRMFPSSGTVRTMDSPEIPILTCFIAPIKVQRAAQAQGFRGMVMIKPKGLEEALQRDADRQAAARAQREADKRERKTMPKEPKSGPTGNTDPSKRGRDIPPGGRPSKGGTGKGGSDKPTPPHDGWPTGGRNR